MSTRTRSTTGQVIQGQLSSSAASVNRALTRGMFTVVIEDVTTRTTKGEHPTPQIQVKYRTVDNPAHNGRPVNASYSLKGGGFQALANMVSGVVGWRWTFNTADSPEDIAAALKPILMGRRQRRFCLEVPGSEQGQTWLNFGTKEEYDAWKNEQVAVEEPTMVAPVMANDQISQIVAATLTAVLSQLGLKS